MRYVNPIERKSFEELFTKSAEDIAMRRQHEFSAKFLDLINSEIKPKSKSEVCRVRAAFLREEFSTVWRKTHDELRAMFEEDEKALSVERVFKPAPPAPRNYFNEVIYLGIGLGFGILIYWIIGRAFGA